MHGDEDGGQIKIGGEREWRKEKAAVKYYHFLYRVRWKG